MATWKQFKAEAPTLAEGMQARFEVKKVAYIATIRKDGSPRVHPVTPLVVDGHLFLYMYPNSPKGKDLQRDGRYMIHTAVDDDEGTGGEFRLHGTAELVEDDDRWHTITQARGRDLRGKYILFELFIESAFSKIYADDGDIKDSWREE